MRCPGPSLTIFALTLLMACAVPGHARERSDGCPSARKDAGNSLSRSMGAIGRFFRDQASNAIFRVSTLPVTPRARMTPEQKATVEGLEPAMPRQKFVGDRFLPIHAAERGFTVDLSGSPGLIEDLAAIRAEGFEPEAVDATVKDFYENTGKYEISVSARTNPIAWPMLRVSNFIAGQMGNGRIPMSGKSEAIRSEVSAYATGLLTQPQPDFVTWTRTYSDGKPAIIGVYQAVQYKGNSYISVVFPYTTGNQVSILRVLNRPDGGITLSSRVKNDPLAGDYFSLIDKKTGAIRKTRKFSLISQQLEVFPDPASGDLKAEHRFYGLRFTGLTLKYDLKEGEAQETANAVDPSLPCLNLDRGAKSVAPEAKPALPSHPETPSSEIAR